MCIIICIPKNNLITNETLKKQFDNCFDSNKDGFGFSFSTGSQVEILKTLSYNDFLIDFFKYYEKFKTISNFAIHFRFSTHGLKDLTNCHPFRTLDNNVFMHNGILSKYGNNQFSDTYEFNEMLKKLPSGLLNNVNFLELLNKMASSENSKFVFMNRKGKISICNKSAGIIENGIWYSNNGYKEVKYSFSKYHDFDYFDFWQKKQAKEVKKEKLDILTCDYCNKKDITVHYDFNNHSYLCSQCVANFSYSY